MTIEAEPFGRVRLGKLSLELQVAESMGMRRVLPLGIDLGMAHPTVFGANPDQVFWDWHVLKRKSPRLAVPVKGFP
jgi:hypothetical protein